MHISFCFLLTTLCSIVSRCFLTSPLATIGNHDAKNSKRHHNFATRANADGCCMHANQVLTRHVDDLLKKPADMHQASNAPVYVCIIAATMCCTYTGNATRTLSMLQHPTRGASFLTRRQDRLFDACGGIVGVWEQPGIVVCQVVLNGHLIVPRQRQQFCVRVRRPVSSRLSCEKLVFRPNFASWTSLQVVVVQGRS